MKITINRNGDDVHIEVERHSMSESRFRALCTLLLAAIGGGVLLGAIALVGFWAIPWAVGAWTLSGVYKLVKNGF